jgi:O-antigen/teichoic acid export membrane protein
MDKKIGTIVFGNAGILISTQVLTKFLGTVFTIIVARKLGVDDYGLYAFAITFGHIFGTVALFGFPQLITRDLARKIDRTSETLGNILTLEAVLSVLAIAAMACTLIILGYDTHRIWIVSIAGAAAMLTVLLDVVAAFFRAHQRMELEAVMRISASVLNMSLGIVVLLMGYGVLELAITQFVVFSLILCFGLFLITRKLAHPSFASTWASYHKLLVAAWPFFLSSICIFTYGSAAMILLSFIKGDQITGLYAGAMNFARIFGFIPAGLVGAVLPAMARLWQDSPEDWKTIYVRSLKYLIIMALPIAVGLMMLSERFVPFVLGDEYTESAYILQMIACVIVLIFINWGLSNALISVNREKTYLRIVSVVLGFNIVANLILIPVWGAYGAVIASLLTEGLMLMIQSYILSKAGLTLSVPAITLKPVLSVLAMALTIHIANGLSLVSVILLAALVYPLALYLFRTFETDEIELLRFWWSTGIARLSGRFKREPGRP